jgi:hypothetical protein
VCESGAGGHDVGNGILGSDFMKADGFGRDSMDAPFGNGDSLKNGECTLLDLLREAALPEKGADFIMGAAMGVGIPVMMGMGVGVMMGMGVPMSVRMIMDMSVRMIM